MCCFIRLFYKGKYQTSISNEIQVTFTNFSQNKETESVYFEFASCFMVT